MITGYLIFTAQVARSQNPGVMSQNEEAGDKIRGRGMAKSPPIGAYAYRLFQVFFRSETYSQVILNSS